MNEKAEDSKNSLKKLLDENPDLKQAFRETIEEMKKPENVKKVSNDFAIFLKHLQEVYNESQRRKKDGE